MQIVIDSCSDLEYNEANDLKINYVPMTLLMNEKEYLDGIEISKDNFYTMLVEQNVFPKTSQPSPQVFIEIFQKAKDNNEDVICLLISSKLSGTIRSAMMAKDIVDYEKIYIIDSLSVSAGIRILLDELLKLKGTSSTLEIVKKLEELKSRITILAGLDTLEYLHKGGRLSKGKLILGSILNMKPVITVENGEVEPIGKAIGITRAFDSIKKYIKNNPIDYNYNVYFGYTMNKERMLSLKSKLGIEGNEIHVGTAIGTHVGPNCYAIFYIKEQV